MFSICITHDDFEVQSLLLIPPYKSLLWFHSLSLCVRLVGVKRERVEIGGRKRGKRLRFFTVWLERKCWGLGFSIHAHQFGSFQVGEKMTVGNEIMKLHTHTIPIISNYNKGTILI